MSAVPWQRREVIGAATLYLADARDVPLADESIDLIFTDPPYGHNNNNGDLIHRLEVALGKVPAGAEAPQARPIANDDPENTARCVRWLFATARRVLRNGSCCCCGGGPDPQFARWALWMNEELAFKQMVIWDKGPMGLGWHYRRSYETVLVAQRGQGACNWFDKSERVENIIRSGDYGIRKVIPKKDDHPTPKPPHLAAHFIRLHSKPGDVVLDPFMGGGSTGVAAMLTGRQFIGVEMEPRWFDMACDRIAEAQHSFVKTDTAAPGFEVTAPRAEQQGLAL